MKRLWAAGAAAAAGVAVLAVLYPRIDPATSLRLTLDRAAAVKAARAFTSRYGVDTTGWKTAVSQEVSDEYREYIRRFPADPAAKLFTLVKVRVALVEPGGKHAAYMALFADGRPGEWKYIAGGKAATPPPSKGRPAAEALGDFVGPAAANFREVESTVQDGVRRRKLRWSAASGFPFSAEFVVEENGGVATAARLEPQFAPGFDDRYQNSRGAAAMIAAYFSESAAFIAALGFLLWSAIHRRARYRIPLMLLAAQAVWVLAAWFAAPMYDRFVQEHVTRGVFDSIIKAAAADYGSAFSAILSLFAFSAAGLALRQPSAGKWFSLDVAARGDVLNRATGRSVAFGLLAGIGLAALPYPISALLGAPLDFRGTETLLAPVPLWLALNLAAAVAGFAVFGFLLRLTGYLRNAAVRWPVFALAGVVVTCAWSPFHASAAVLLWGALMFAGCWAVYAKGDLLALAAALIATRAATLPGVLLVQPSGAVRGPAITILTLFALGLGFALHLAMRGREPGAEAETYSAGFEPAATQSDRERLQAEFAVARKAQQDALPASAPALPGYAVAASCEPAQQVGGDLYDFFHLPDGRVGITVADVSGKGVRAALYMMVTKGLLSAVAGDTADVRQILQQINLHLYRVCRRKVFVTLAAVVLDAATGRCQYGRAGHNPVLWRRTRRGETLVLKPHGLGLGLVAGEGFARNLQVQELDLEPDDALVLYSDGVTEAVNGQMEEFGEARLIRSLERTDGRSATETHRAILEELASFMGMTPARDDITLVVLRAG